MKIKTTNLTENFDEEIEEIFLEKGIITDDKMVYEGHTIASVPFSSQEEEIAFVQDKCIIVEDDNNYYIAAKEKDVTKSKGEDYIVQKCLKEKYTYFEGEL